MQHQKAGNLVRKDQARRLRYQEAQRIRQKLVNTGSKSWVSAKLPEGELKSFASKLVK